MSGKAPRPAPSFEYEAVGRLVRIVEDAGLPTSPTFTSQEPEPIKGYRTVAWDAREALWGSISFAFTVRSIYLLMTSAPQAQARFARLERIANLAKRLRNEIDADPLVASLHLRSGMARGERSMFSLVEDLALLEEVAAAQREILQEDGGHLNPPLPADSGEADLAPGDVFMLRLGEAFRNHFHQEPKILHDKDREPHGPFLAFVMEIRRMAGEPVTAEAVKKAWDRARDKDQKTD